jgi:hypothetical protein
MPEQIVPKVIYGDGTNEVAVAAESVIITGEDSMVVLSRASFREVVIGWERLREEEQS